MKKTIANDFGTEQPNFLLLFSPYFLVMINKKKLDYNMKVNFVLVHCVLEKNVHYLIIYNLKKPEPIFKNFGMQYPDYPGFYKHLWTENK